MSFSLCNERMVMLKYYCEDAESVLREVGSSEEGLSSGEAAKRLERDGRNELAAEKKDSLIKRFFAQKMCIRDSLPSARIISYKIFFSINFSPAHRVIIYRDRQTGDEPGHEQKEQPARDVYKRQTPAWCSTASASTSASGA